MQSLHSAHGMPLAQSVQKQQSKRGNPQFFFISCRAFHATPPDRCRSADYGRVGQHAAVLGPTRVSTRPAASEASGEGVQPVPGGAPPGGGHGWATRGGLRPAPHGTAGASEGVVAQVSDEMRALLPQRHRCDGRRVKHTPPCHAWKMQHALHALQRETLYVD